MERTDWPSSEQMNKLRERGALPYSPFAAACLAAIVLLLVAYFLTGTLKALTIAWSQLAARAEAGGVIGALKESGSSTDLLAVFAAPAGAVLAAYLLGGMLQTGFFFRPAGVAPDFTRLNPFKAGGGEGFWSRFLQLVVEVMLALAAGFTAVYALATGMIGLLNHNQTFFLKFCVRQAQALLPVLILVLLALGLLGALAVQFVFRFTHRMSRQERGRETRE